MHLREAMDYVSRMDCSGHKIKLIDHKRLRGDILVIITEDTITTDEIPAMLSNITTRRLSVFVGNHRQVGTIVDP